MSSALLSHLVTLFSGELRSAYRADQFVGLLAPIFDSSPGDVLPNGVTTAVPTSGWGYWVERYRSCLDVLRDLFGLPGCIFQVSVDSGLTVTPA
jgi:hypothetical protein